MKRKTVEGWASEFDFIQPQCFHGDIRDSRKYDTFRGKQAVLIINLLGKGLTQEINGDGGSFWWAPDVLDLFFILATWPTTPSLYLSFPVCILGLIPPSSLNNRLLAKSNNSLLAPTSNLGFSLLPVPTEWERRVGKRTWERGFIGSSSQISPLSLLSPSPNS